MIRYPFSLDWIVPVSDDGSVVYRAEKSSIHSTSVKHCGLWERASSRTPSEETEPEQGALDLEHIPFDDFAAAQ